MTEIVMSRPFATNPAEYKALNELGIDLANGTFEQQFRKVFRSQYHQ